MRFAWKWTGVVSMALCIVWAVWRGEKPERTGGLILAAAWGATMLVHRQGVYSPELAVILVDVAGLAGFIWLSLWSRRLWTVFMAAFQLDAVAAHIATLLSPHISGFTYITTTGLWGGYGLTFALAAGMWGVERRRRAAEA